MTTRHEFESLQDAVLFAVKHGLGWMAVRPIMGNNADKCEGYFVELQEDGEKTT